MCTSTFLQTSWRYSCCATRKMLRNKNKPPPDARILQIRAYEDKLQDMKSKCTDQVLLSASQMAVLAAEHCSRCRPSLSSPQTL